jgi:hypothetical protein
MKFDEDGMVDIETIGNIDEARAFVRFLISERNRHFKDIDLIGERIDKVCEKFPECYYLKGVVN